jgi:hypothetical protein
MQKGGTITTNIIQSPWPPQSRIQSIVKVTCYFEFIQKKSPNRITDTQLVKQFTRTRTRTAVVRPTVSPATEHSKFSNHVGTHCALEKEKKA